MATSAIVTAAAAEAGITPESYYTNDYYIGGVGFYHAPFRGFFERPYNEYDSGRNLYYQGGQWLPTPHRSIVNISAPTPEAAQLAQQRRTDRVQSHYVPRAGFGSTGSSNPIRS